MTLNLDQQRASWAWKKASEGVEQFDKRYVVLAKGAPALIVGNGLMQTLAFYRTKAGNSGTSEHALLREHISQWLGRQLGGENLANGETFPPDNDDFTSIMNALFQADSSLYRRATRESLALLKWIRQFADAVSKDRSS